MEFVRNVQKVSTLTQTISAKLRIPFANNLMRMMESVQNVLMGLSYRKEIVR